MLYKVREGYAFHKHHKASTRIKSFVVAGETVELSDEEVTGQEWKLEPVTEQETEAPSSDITPQKPADPNPVPVQTTAPAELDSGAPNAGTGADDKLAQAKASLKMKVKG